MESVSPAQYLEVRAALWERGYADEWEWAQTVQPPQDATSFAQEAIWVICCSGFKEQRARVTQGRVMAALDRGESARNVFPVSGKGRAIDTLWQSQDAYFREFSELLCTEATPEEVVAWVGTLPYVGGKILRYHFAKNLGVDCAKPDRWICRLAGVPESTPVDAAFAAAMALCRPIAEATGDRVATVDLVLWRACNLGLLKVEGETSEN